MKLECEKGWRDVMRKIKNREKEREREENLNGKFQKNLKIRTLIRKEEFKIRTQERYKTWNENGNEIRK